MNKPSISLGRDNQIYVFAFFTSIVLSFLLSYRSSVVNPDGICYLLSAQMVGSGSLRDAMQICPQAKWPLYSTLIHALVQISHLSYVASAYVLNALFSLVSVVTFIMIAKELGGTKRIMWLAALVILFDHQFNVLRDNIIRDHGFWAFYLVSIYLLLKYFRESKWTTAIAWNLSLITATLFRIEGAIFLLAMPFMSWFYLSRSLKERAKSFFTLNSLLILACIAFAGWQISHPQHTMQKLGRFNEVIHQLHNGLFIVADRYQAGKAALIQHVLPSDAAPDAGVVLFLVLIGMYLYNVVLTLSCGYAALVIYAWKSRAAKFLPRSALVVWGYLGVNLIMTLGFLAEHWFVSKRYLVALTLVCIIWVPFAFNDLIEKWTSVRHRIFLIAAALVVFISAMSSVIEFGPSKSYIRSAGDWIASNVPANATLYVNDFQLMYYTQHFNTRIFETLPQYLQMNLSAEGQWKKFNYLALRLNNKEESGTAALLQEMAAVKPIQVFSNQRGDRVAIYKIS